MARIRFCVLMEWDLFGVTPLFAKCKELYKRGSANKKAFQYYAYRPLTNYMLAVGEGEGVPISHVKGGG